MGIEKAKKLAKYCEELAGGPDWGVDDQDTLEWLISKAESSKKYEEFFSSVSCLFAEGVEFMNKIEIYDAIKKDWQKVLDQMVKESRPMTEDLEERIKRVLA